MKQSDKYRVLWVDDEIDKLIPYILALENNDFEVTCASSREKAEEILAKEQFHIIVSDLLMPPPGNPIAFLEYAKNKCPKATLCVASGYLENNEYRRSLEKLSLKPVLVEKPFPDKDSQGFINLFINMVPENIGFKGEPQEGKKELVDRVIESSEIKPGIFGIKFDVKKFLGK